MHSLTRRAFLAASLIAAFAGCSSARYQPRDPQPATTLIVRNDNYLEHTIFLLYGSQRIRLGTARSNTTTKLVIPPQYVFGVSTLQFLADPIGSRTTPVSDKISVSPGDEVELIIPPISRMMSVRRDARPPDQ